MLVNSITKMYIQEYLYSCPYLIHLSLAVDYEDNEHHKQCRRQCGLRMVLEKVSNGERLNS